MPYYRKPEKHLDYVSIGRDQEIKSGYRKAPFSKLPPNHPVMLRLRAAGIGFIGGESIGVIESDLEHWAAKRGGRMR